MSKIEHNGIYYDPHNEIVCDKLRLKELIEENESKDKTIADLEAKLAEKELVLDKILTEIHTNCYSGLNIVKFKEMVLNDLGSVVIRNNQDKISFAVEQLEKVKAKYPRGTISWGIGKSEDGFEYVSDFIDNQIEELKKNNSVKTNKKKRIETMANMLAHLITNPVFIKEPFKEIWDFYFGSMGCGFMSEREVLNWLNEDVLWRDDEINNN